MTKEELEIAKAACCVGTIWDEYEGTEDFDRMVKLRLNHLIELVRKSKPSLPSNLDEVTMDFARELDFFLYGSYAPERFPNSMQVRDEHSGLKVNDWKCWVNRPELRIEMVKHFFTLGKQAGAEWMAGQGVTKDGLVAAYDNGCLRVYTTILDKEDGIKFGDKLVVQIRKK